MTLAHAEIHSDFRGFSSRLKLTPLLPLKKYRWLSTTRRHYLSRRRLFSLNPPRDFVRAKTRKRDLSSRRYGRASQPDGRSRCSASIVEIIVGRDKNRRADKASNRAGTEMEKKENLTTTTTTAVTTVTTMTTTTRAKTGR